MPESDARAWAMRIFPLGSEPSDDLSATTTAEERLRMVWTLTARMWELTGQPLPAYRRAEMPVKVVHRG
jgi:hypothetical protein